MTRGMVHDPERPPVRFAFVDGLRGIAALGIATYHIWRYEPPVGTSQPPTYAAAQFVPGFVDWVLLRNWFGVHVLLVVSGFVIAYTLRKTWVTPREAVSFVVRRVVRLWPPYAVTLLLVLIFHAACVNWWDLPSPIDEPLSIGRVLAHTIFLQEILGQSPLSAGIWTVGIEMQFYVVCVLGLWHVQTWLPWLEQDPVRHSPTGLWLLLWPFALISLLEWNRLESTEPWVTHFLCSFFLGMVTWWTLDRSISRGAFALTVAVVAGQLMLQWRPEVAYALATALAIFVAGQTGHLHDWLNWRWLQYVGRISYSFYLIHYPVSHLVMWVGWRWCGNSPTPAQASLILLLCLVASLGAGHLLHLAVEIPSHRWSARLKSGRRVVMS